MADQLRDIVQRMVDAGESEQDIALVIQRLSHETPKPESEHPHAKVGEWVKENAPMLGGALAGGLTAGAGLIPAALAAAGGGFLGARARGDDRADAANAGLWEGGTQAAGGLVTKGLVGGARRLYGGLLKPSKAVKDSFGNAKEIADTLLAERVPISQGGVAKITGRLGDSRAAALKVVQEAQDAGAQGVIPKDVISEFAPVITELRKRIDIAQPGARAGMAAVGARGRGIIDTASRKGGAIPLTRAQQLKETAQDAAYGATKVQQKQLSPDDLLDASVARGMKQGVERNAPLVASHNQRTQKLLGGKRAVEDAVDREASNNVIGGGRDWAALGAAGLGAAGGGPAGAAASGALMRLLATPSTGSRMAIGANELARLPMAQLIRAIQMGVLSQDEP